MKYWSGCQSPPGCFEDCQHPGYKSGHWPCCGAAASPRPFGLVWVLCDDCLLRGAQLLGPVVCSFGFAFAFFRSRPACPATLQPLGGFLICKRGVNQRTLSTVARHKKGLSRDYNLRFWRSSGPTEWKLCHFAAKYLPDTCPATLQPVGAYFTM